ncbi:hypothetical protein ACE1CI_10620 [Aerosakkonemataceae cyanobacterium BLCC-F50]|uniref:Uncharacterized protein n=1 Tax=Floridaenema flaviceps BLCC-F50 TaxID=3153642 RepID=A0ABV4XNT0_9CYAN
MKMTQNKSVQGIEMEIESSNSAFLALATTFIRVGTLCLTIGTIFILALAINSLIQNKISGSAIPEVPSFQEPLSFSQIVDTDSIALPPAQEAFYSTDRNYVFVLSTPDNWKSKQAEGQLFQVNANRRKLLWTRRLPHEYRPRYVLVGNRGQVLLFDEWINVKSRYAVMELNRENRLVFEYDFDAIQKVLGVPEARIVEMARYGWWIGSRPTLDTSGETARVEVAGKILTINLNSGHLSKQ